MFKAQILDLVASWIQQERGIHFLPLSKNAFATYVGGLGEAGETPVLFFVDEEGQHGQQPRSQEILSDPLRVVKSQQESSSELDDTGIRITTGRSQGMNRASVEPAIVEVGKIPGSVSNESKTVGSIDSLHYNSKDRNRRQL